jgi:hypothetical protein
MWHGVSGAESWKRICEGEGLRLPTVHAHDVGDYGRGVYFTSSLVRARIYSRRLDGHYPIVRAYVRLKNAIILDWSKGQAMHPESPAFQTVEALRREYGDPLHGSDEARAQAASRWRGGLLAHGIDGIVALHSQDIEAVTYKPEDAIRSYACLLKKAKG